MFCKKCGFQNSDNVPFCTNCGNTMTQVPVYAGIPPAPPVQQNSGLNKGNGIFVSSDETQVAVLGGGYFNNYLKSGSLSRGFCVVSNKRLYFKGKTYILNGRSASKVIEESAVDLKDVTGSGFTQVNPLSLLIFAIIFFTTAAASILIGLSNEDKIPTVSLIFGFISLIFLILYNVFKVRMFRIVFAGGAIAFKANNHSKSEIREFQKELRLAIDRRNEEIYAAIAGNRVR